MNHFEVLLIGKGQWMMIRDGIPNGCGVGEESRFHLVPQTESAKSFVFEDAILGKIETKVFHNLPGNWARRKFSKIEFGIGQFLYAYRIVNHCADEALLTLGTLDEIVDKWAQVDA